MRRWLTLIVVSSLACAAGGAYVFWALKLAPQRRLPDPPALVLQMREVARLTTLEVSLYKKVSFEPHPGQTDALWKDVFNWARFTLNPKKGKAIVFADAQVGFDFARLDRDSVRLSGDTVEIVLPPMEVRVELKPGETEVIGSNLDSADTAELFALAKEAFEQEVRQDAELQGRARRGAQIALEVFLRQAGFRQVRFVEAFAPVGAL